MRGKRGKILVLKKPTHCKNEKSGQAFSEKALLPGEPTEGQQTETAVQV